MAYANKSRKHYVRPAQALLYRSIETMKADARIDLNKESVVVPDAGIIRPNAFGTYDEASSQHDAVSDVVCSGAPLLMGGPGTGGYYLGITANDAAPGDRVDVFTEGKFYLPLDWLGDADATPVRLAASDKGSLVGKPAYWLKDLGLVTDKLPAAVESSDEITLTSSQTTVNSASITWDTTGRGLKVYMVGAASGTPDKTLLTLGTDYTITDNNTIELESGATANDKLYIESVVQLHHLHIGEFVEDSAEVKPEGIRWGHAFALVNLRRADSPANAVAAPADGAISHSGSYAVFASVSSRGGLTVDFYLSATNSDPNVEISASDFSTVVDSAGLNVTKTGDLFSYTFASANTFTVDVTIGGTTFNFEVTTHATNAPVIVRA